MYWTFFTFTSHYIQKRDRNPIFRITRWYEGRSWRHSPPLAQTLKQFTFPPARQVFWMTFNPATIPTLGFLLENISWNSFWPVNPKRNLEWFWLKMGKKRSLVGICVRLGINGTVFSRFEVIGRGREISDNNANGKLVFIPTSLSCNKFPSASRKKIIIQFH